MTTRKVKIIIAAVCAVILSGCAGTNLSGNGAVSDLHSHIASMETTDMEFPVCGLTIRFSNMPVGDLSPAEVREVTAKSPTMSAMLNATADSEFCRDWRASHKLGVKNTKQPGNKPLCVYDKELGLYFTPYHYEWGVDIIISTVCP